MKLLILLFLLLVVVVGGGWFARQAYRAWKSARVAGWHAKTIEVSGVEGELQQRLLSVLKPYHNKPVSATRAVQLRQMVTEQYPMLKNVVLKRGFISGKLTLKAEHRTPLAKLQLSNGQTRYLDADSTVYSDAAPTGPVPTAVVELEGEVPAKLNAQLVELVESTGKLHAASESVRLQFNGSDHTVRMHLSDGSVILFGPAVQLKKKAARAAQIMALARQKYQAPFVLNFLFFENGQVFLTQKAR
ncbi:MAG: C58 family peptidase [Elusimicrobiaceae bacterium]|nr:C58 family peptidase [Elusimicrobiaceae bacterium]